MPNIQNDPLLNGASSVVLDGNGYGIIRIAPQGELWQIRAMTMRTIETFPPSLEAIGRIYLDVASPMNLKATCYSASSGGTASANGEPLNLTDGQPFYVEWTGGTPGVTAVCTYSGITSSISGGFRAVR